MHKVSVECVPPLPGNTVQVHCPKLVVQHFFKNFKAQTITHVAQSSVLHYDDGMNDVTLEKDQTLFQCVEIAFVIMKMLMQCHIVNVPLGKQ